MSEDLTQEILGRMRRAGFALAGVCDARPIDRPEFLQAWLQAGHGGEMDWLAAHLAERIDPGVLVPGARSVVCVADRDRARQIAMSSGRGYLNTMVNLYHSTMPKQKHAVIWPDAPHAIPDEDTLDWLIEKGYLLCGNPDEVNEQIAKYQEVGCDQLVFGIPNEGFRHEEVLEMIELFGAEVIPNFDTDPEHRTTKFRRTAQRKYPDFAEPMPEGLDVSVLPENALIPLGG